MIKYHNKNENLNNIIKTLDKEGIFIVKDFITGNDLKIVYDEVLNLCKTSGNQYEFGNYYRKNNVSGNLNIDRIFNDKWIKSVDKLYRKSDFGFCSSIYATYDYNLTNKMARNGWLHFDRENCLKFFFYLTDVTKESGALTVCPNSKKTGTLLRKNAWKNKTYNNVPNRIDIDYPSIKNNFDLFHIEEKAGTLIVFDTDVFHMGGNCKPGYERLIVRGHCK